MEALCPASGLVLDPFYASVFTLIGAQMTSRDYADIVLDAQHCETVRMRVACNELRSFATLPRLASRGTSFAFRSRSAPSTSARQASWQRPDASP
ncbi:hypothetical protein [Bradyrhizobium sp. CB2312]|uniref:hypothetical protein n=1 Tax=Bradyrhizobium sp. CB2312 TaxID=3039155 RepID=UPI0024B1999F|nr:hypothetical protein [Bradyrhizobium sp. CB2312]WFU77161.1 hypothetical protein QA642_41150 [Bradyrhizobium sp. CB2312]